jgi:hypothetical protein
VRNPFNSNLNYSASCLVTPTPPTSTCVAHSNCFSQANPNACCAKLTEYNVTSSLSSSINTCINFTQEGQQIWYNSSFYTTSECLPPENIPQRSCVNDLDCINSTNWGSQCCGNVYTITNGIQSNESSKLCMNNADSGFISVFNTSLSFRGLCPSQVSKQCQYDVDCTSLYGTGYCCGNFTGGSTSAPYNKMVC